MLYKLGYIGNVDIKEFNDGTTEVNLENSEITLSGIIYYTENIKILEKLSLLSEIVSTGIVCFQQTINNCKDTDTDLVEVSAHLGARPEHEEWQGKVYCLSGERDYIYGNGETKHDYNFYEVCHYGEPTGICGINCRHSFYPYFEGMETEYSTGELDEYKEKTVKLNGEDVSVYEAEQKMRMAERNIRKYKREVDALEIVGADAMLEKEKLKVLIYIMKMLK